MENEVRLLILIEVKPGKAQEKIELYEKIKPLVLSEDGCLQYELNRVAGSDVLFVLNERWSSQHHLAKHDETSHMREADALSPSFRAKPAKVFKLGQL